MKPGIAVVAAASLTFVAACTDPAVVTSQPESFGNTRDGAIIGGVLGAATGLITGDTSNRVRNMAVGAAIGAGVGGAVGNRLDRQEAALRQDLGNGNIDIVNDGTRLVVTLPQDILFPVSSAALQPAFVPDLQAVARNLNQFPDGIVQVVGHTDNTGSVEYNFALSQRRAQSVTDVLVGAGVPPGRIQTIGRGDDQPRASNLTPEGRALNRRTEIVIIPSST
jgi:outer membrane protein OmpA-like peptidoglycan-associated protein